MFLPDKSVQEILISIKFNCKLILQVSFNKNVYIYYLGFYINITTNYDNEYFFIIKVVLLNNQD